MKLYYYEHCPYCIRVLAFIELKGIELEKKILASDDEKTPINMVGVKMLPILQKDDGSFMAESLDIIEYLDNLNSPILDTYQPSPAIEQWMAEAKSNWHHLLFPRLVKMPFVEFSTASARDYFSHKKEKVIGDFGQALTNSDKYIQLFSVNLGDLEGLLISATPEKISLDDIVLFAMLHGMTTVKNIGWSGSMEQYIVYLSEQFQLDLLTEQAI